MRRIFSILLVCNLCLVILVGSMVLLAETYPLHPGSPAYSLQHLAEQWRLRLAATPERRSELAIELAERRLADLALAQDEDHILAASQAFDQALNQAVLQCSELSEQLNGSLAQRMDSLLAQADIVVAAFPSLEGSELLQALAQKIAVLKATENNQDRQAIAQPRPSLPSRITAELISFLGKDVDHGLFPMNGGHTGLDCLDCHTNGEYADTPGRCSYCHALPLVRLPGPVPMDPEVALDLPLYPNHFPGECEDCHRVSSWQPFAFDHQGISECLSCHAHDLPHLAADPDLSTVVFVSSAPFASFGKPDRQDHYPGECAACHSDTADWSVASFEHTGVRECYSCHEQETPNRHYSGRCVDCHNDLEDWSVAEFNHSGHVDCLSCHSDDAPAEHYAGQCSACHDTTIWERAIFNHTGYDDCRSCHDRPVKHYPGNCSACHDPDTWEIITFTHRKTSDCTACHDTPAGHYDASCTTCHTTTDWQRSLFSHTIYSSCTNCHSGELPNNHYELECSACHGFSEWSSISFSHEGHVKCETCHNPPDSHYPGSCVNCHTPVSWDKIVFNHSGFTDCTSCHIATPGHYAGQCSDCHNTTDWHTINIDHSTLTDCDSCHIAKVGHYDGQCSNCHNTIDWNMIDFDHTNYTDCISCHPTPYGHWPGQCSDCHTTVDWLDVTFDHITYTNCKACHSRPAGHPRGQCSNCHTTDTWLIGTPTPAPLFALPVMPAVDDNRSARPDRPSDEEPVTRSTPQPAAEEPVIRETPAP